MKEIVVSILLLATAVGGVRAENIKGTVKTTEGRGLSGVVVSDGLNVVQTDDKGRFEMDIDQDSRFVFISTPAGYTSATLEGETLFYKRIGKKVKSYDFVVGVNPKDDKNHNLIVIADPQISDRSELPELEKYAEDMAEYVKQMDGDFTLGLCLGDIVGWDHSIYPEYNRIMAKTELDYRYVIGNHDMTNWGRSHETSMTDFENMYGPCWYSFNVGEVHYIVLNDNFFVGRDWFYIGYIDERQLSWLEKDLSYVPKGSSVVVSMHIPTTLDKTRVYSVGKAPPISMPMLAYIFIMSSMRRDSSERVSKAGTLASFRISNLMSSFSLPTASLKREAIASFSTASPSPLSISEMSESILLYLTSLSFISHIPINWVSS